MNASKNNNTAIANYEFTEKSSYQHGEINTPMASLKKQCSAIFNQAKLTLCVTGGLLLWMAVVVPSTPILQMKRHITRTDMCAKKKH